MLVPLTTGYYNERHIFINISIIYKVARHRRNWKGGGQNRPWVWGALRRSQEGEDWFEYYFPFHHSLPIFFWPLFNSVAPLKILFVGRKIFGGQCLLAPPPQITPMGPTIFLDFALVPERLLTTLVLVTTVTAL